MIGNTVTERPMPAWMWLLLAALFAGATLAVGWGSVPVLAAAAATIGTASGRRASGGGVAGAAALGWATLLGWDLAGPRARDLTQLLAGLTGLPPVSATASLALLTLAFAALLAWAAATLMRWAVLAARGLRVERAWPGGPTHIPSEVTLPAPGPAAPPAGSPAVRS